MVSGREALKSASGMYSALTSYRDHLLEKPLKELPFGEMMDNFKNHFERVFIQQKPNTIDQYFLSKLNIVQIANTRLYDDNRFSQKYANQKSNQRTSRHNHKWYEKVSVNNLFSFRFTKTTSKEVEYTSSHLTKKMIKQILKHIGNLENFETAQKTKENAPSVKIQMYEFFFSHILVKAMQVPFLDHTFMLGFFERNIRKRTTGESSRGKRKILKRRDHEEARRDRTMTLRPFYEFFSLLYDHKLFEPFAQFLSDESLKDLKIILQTRIKKKDSSQNKESYIGKLKGLKYILSLIYFRRPKASE